MSTQPSFVSVPHIEATKLYATASASLPADTTTYVDLFTGSSSGSLVRAINVTTDSAVAVTVKFALGIGTNTYPIGTVDIPAGAGMSAGVPALNLCDPVFIPIMEPIPNRGFHLTSGAKLQVSLPTAVLATDKNMYITVLGGDF